MQLLPFSELRTKTRDFLWRFSPGLLLSIYLYFQFPDPWYFRLPTVLLGGLFLETFGLLAVMIVRGAVQWMRGGDEPEGISPREPSTHSVAAMLLCVALWLFLQAEQADHMRHLGECMDEYQATHTFERNRPSGILRYCQAEARQEEVGGS